MAINHTHRCRNVLTSVREIIRVHIQEIQQIRKDRMMLEFLFLHCSVTSASSDEPLRTQVLPNTETFYKFQYIPKFKEKQNEI